MASLTEAREHPADQLWDEIDRIHAGMLGLEGERHHMQPMAPHADRVNNSIWFFTKTSSELVKAIRAGSRAHFCVIGKDHDYHACASGPITVRRDKEKIDEFWNSVTAAWYEGGKDDPELVLLAMHLDDAEIWASTGSTVKFGWEIAKANLTDEKVPDIGVRQHLKFA